MHAKNLMPQTLESLAAHGIFSNLVRLAMRATIDFDDEPSFAAKEICEIAVYRCLPDKFKATQLTIVKMFP